MIKYLYIIEPVGDKIYAGCMSIVINGEKIKNSKFIYSEFNSIEELKLNWAWSFKDELNHTMLNNFVGNSNSEKDYPCITDEIVKFFIESYESNIKQIHDKNREQSNKETNLTYADLFIKAKKILNRAPLAFEMNIIFTLYCVKYANHIEDNPSDLINLNLYEFYIKKERLNRDDFTVEDFLFTIIEVKNIVDYISSKEKLPYNYMELFNEVGSAIDSDLLVNGDLTSLIKVISRSLFVLFVISNGDKAFRVDNFIKLDTLTQEEAINSIISLVIN